MNPSDQGVQIRTGVNRRISLDQSAHPQKAVDTPVRIVRNESPYGQELRPSNACAKRIKKSKRNKLLFEKL